MPSQQEVKWSQLKVGVIVLVSLVLLTTLLFLMTSASGMSVFSKKIIATTYFPNSSGLTVGSPVTLEGVTIGEVKEVTVTTDPKRKLSPVKVVMRLDPHFKKSLHTDTKASLSTVGVLGDTIVDLNSAVATGPELKSGDELKTLETPTLQDVVKESQGTVESLNVILAKVDDLVDTIKSGKGSAGKLIEDPTLYNEATATVKQLHALTVSLNDGHGTVGKLMHDEQLYDRLNDTAAKLDEIATSLHAGKGSAGKLLTDDSLYNNLNGTLQHTNSLLAGVDEGKGGVGLMMKDPAFAQKLNDTVTQLDEILTGINSGQGTLGKLTKDPAAYDNLNKLLANSSDLVTTIRQDPKKYLTIHMKIF
jgi:phospholipid/cholesterol/gamma-HCH transport system substrate-binding protein